MGRQYSRYCTRMDMTFLHDDRFTSVHKHVLEKLRA
jgi:hypothetical protein